MSARRDMGGDIRADVVAAGQERGYHDGLVATGRGKYFARCGSQDVDEGNSHRAAEMPAHLCGQVADHRDTARPAGTVRGKDQAHDDTAGSSIASR
ncbi:hypothetical protein ATCCBAA256_28250 [Mycobacterium montefiorense]|nr:hypothetical protein ATCCBAA256_28250 [Mycobacterium montefiorense]